MGSEAPSARMHGQQPWEGVLQHTEICIQVIRPSRGQGVIPDVLGAHRPTLWGSDRSRAPQNHPAEDWQVCWAHQGWECPCAIDAGETVCAPRLKAVFLRACALHTRRDPLAASPLSQDRWDRQRRVRRGLPLQLPTPHGRRVQTRSAKIQDHVCLVRDDATIPPAHHASEQAIRLSTVVRKVTHGFRSDWGRDLFAAVSSGVNTGTRQGLSAFQAIQNARTPMGSLFGTG